MFYLRVLVQFLGLTAKEYDKHDNDKATMSTMMATTVTATAATPTTGMVVTMATTTKVTALSPFVNLGMQYNRRRAEPWMKKVTTFCVVVGRQKGFAREHQHGFL